jgi:hypothetical protein
MRFLPRCGSGLRRAQSEWIPFNLLGTYVIGERDNVFLLYLYVLINKIKQNIIIKKVTKSIPTLRSFIETSMMCILHLESLPGQRVEPWSWDRRDPSV